MFSAPSFLPGLANPSTSSKRLGVSSKKALSRIPISVSCPSIEIRPLWCVCPCIPQDPLHKIFNSVQGGDRVHPCLDLPRHGGLFAPPNQKPIKMPRVPFFVLFRLGMEGEKRELTWLVRKIRSGLVVRGHVKSPGTASAAAAMMRLLMPAEVKTERKKQLGSQRNSTLMPCRQTIPCESESAKCMQSFVFQVVYFKHALKRSKQWKTNRASRGG